MSEEAAAPVAVESASEATKKVAAKKSAAPKKPKSKPAHPKTGEMVNAAISALKDKKGSSFHAIKKHIAANYLVDVEKHALFIKKYLKSAVENKTIIQTKGIGASGRFRLATISKDKKKVTKKPVAKKPAGEKKVVAKKPAAAKKPVEKKAAAAKKQTAAKKPAAKPKAAKEAKPKVAKEAKPKAAKEVKPKIAKEAKPAKAKSAAKDKKGGKAPAASKPKTPKPKTIADLRAKTAKK